MADRSLRLFGRDFLLLWQGQLVSQLGNQAFLVATLSWTLQATGSPGLMGLLLMASTLPAVLFGPIAGAVADRHSRRRIIVATDLLRGLGHLGLACVMVATPDATTLIVRLFVALGFVSGVLGSLLTPAFAAAVPDLVPVRRLDAANSLHHMSAQTATLLGQAAGGLAYAWVGASGLIVFDGLTFVASAALAALARVPSPAARTDSPVRERVMTYLRDVRAGVTWLWRRPRLRSLILAFTGVNFLFTPVFVLLPVYVKDVLARGPEWYGFLLAGSGGGAMAGAALAPLTQAGRTGVVWSLLGIGLCTILLGARLSAPLALAALVAVGLFSGILNVRVMTMLQESTPAGLRGRIMAVAVALAGAAVPAGSGWAGCSAASREPRCRP